MNKQYKYEDAYDFIFNNSNEDLIRYRHKYFLSLNREQLVLNDDLTISILGEDELNSLRKAVLQYSKINENDDHKAFYKFISTLPKVTDPDNWDVDFSRFYSAFEQHKKNLKSKDTPGSNVNLQKILGFADPVTIIEGSCEATGFEDARKDIPVIHESTSGKYSEAELRKLWSIPDEYRARKIKTNVYSQNTKKDGLVTVYQTTADFEKPVAKAELAPTFTDQQLKNYFESLAKEGPNFSNRIEYKSDSGKRLVQIMLPDLHYGLQLYDQENNETYSPQIVENYLYSLLANELPAIITDEVEIIILAIGNDFFHYDSVKNSTTNGTELNDLSLNYLDLFGRAVNFLHEYIDTLSEMFKQTKIVVISVPGNHDTVSSSQTSVALKAIYSKNNQVDVIYSNDTYYFYRWGKSLLAYVHGDQRINNPKDLANLMLSLRPVDYSECVTRIWNLGHFHRAGEKYLSENGILCKFYPTLAPPDSWSKSKGYVNSFRAVEILTFDFNFGHVKTDIISVERL